MTLREELAKMFDDLADSEEKAAWDEFAKGTEIGDTLGRLLVGCSERSRACAAEMREVRNLELRG